MSISAIDGPNWVSPLYNKDKDRQKVQGNSDPVLGLLGGNAAISPGAPEEEKKNDPVKEFTDYMSKTPEQRFQEAWLKQRGISPEEFAAMSPAEQKKLLDEMRREMEERMRAQLGAEAKGANADLIV